jgi:hypothetical protein
MKKRFLLFFVCEGGFPPTPPLWGEFFPRPFLGAGRFGPFLGFVRSHGTGGFFSLLDLKRHTRGRANEKKKEKKRKKKKKRKKEKKKKKMFGT